MHQISKKLLWIIPVAENLPIVAEAAEDIKGVGMSVTKNEDLNDMPANNEKLGTVEIGFHIITCILEIIIIIVTF